MSGSALSGKALAAIAPAIAMTLTAGLEHCARIEAERSKVEVARILSEAGQASAIQAREGCD